MSTFLLLLTHTRRQWVRQFLFRTLSHAALFRAPQAAAWETATAAPIGFSQSPATVVQVSTPYPTTSPPTTSSPISSFGPIYAAASSTKICSLIGVSWPPAAAILLFSPGFAPFLAMTCYPNTFSQTPSAAAPFDSPESASLENTPVPLILFPADLLLLPYLCLLNLLLRRVRTLTVSSFGPPSPAMQFTLRRADSRIYKSAAEIAFNGWSPQLKVKNSNLTLTSNCAYAEHL